MKVCDGLYFMMLYTLSVAACAHLGTQVTLPRTVKPPLSASCCVSPLQMEPGRLAGGDDGGGGSRSEESWEGRECREGGN